VDSIRDAVEGAWERYERDAELRKRLRSRILTEFTWQAAAAATFRAYETTCR
jgi:hypothetical protein